MDLRIINEREAYSVLLKPSLIGEELRKSTLKSMRKIFSHIKDIKNPLELVILSGGIYYQTQKAYHDVFKEDLPRILVGAKRNCEDEEWKVNINYKNIEAWKEDPTLIITDTIATGCSVVRTLEYLKSLDLQFNRLIIAGFAIAKKGAQLIDEYCSEKGIQVIFLVGGGLLGLAENGTDMSILHKDAEVCDDLKKDAIEVYGEEMGSKICSIWDWGRRNQAFDQHIHEVKEKLQEFPNNKYAKKIFSDIR